MQPSRSVQAMSAVNADMSLKELLQLVADNHHGKISLSDDDKTLAVGLLKSKGMDELDYGEEMKVDKVRLVKRVTGAMGLYFS
ncbi:MAG: hypothetical protein R3F51_17850 [Cyanobacteriota/Melainabacteria group bacterium]